MDEELSEIEECLETYDEELDALKYVAEMDEVSQSYSLAEQAKMFFSQKRFSDVIFIVGDLKNVIYAIKAILSFGSPVFERMFYGELRMNTSKPIAIPDLTSVGFLNMMKYLYGYDVKDFKWTEIYETYRAGDKYLVQGLTSALDEHMKDSLDSSNCSIILDQLLNFEESNTIRLNQVKECVQFNSAIAFKSDLFLDVHNFTLSQLLDFESLAIEEFELLKAVSRWITAECLRKGLTLDPLNKQKLFAPFKNFIKFSQITIAQFTEFNQIEELLAVNEVASLFVHLLDHSKPFLISCRTSRKFFKFHQTIAQGSSNFLVQKIEEFNILLNVNRNIVLKSIYTHLNGDVDDFVFSVFENDKQLSFNYCSISECGKLVVKLSDFVRIDSTKDYKLAFSFSPIEFDPEIGDILSSNNRIEHRDGNDSFVFELNFDNLSCIRKLEFFVSSYYGYEE